jgi:hypothetical protein
MRGHVGNVPGALSAWVEQDGRAQLLPSMRAKGGPVNEADFPPKLRPWWHPQSLLGSIFVGGYPRDKKIRTTALYISAIVALWSVVKDGVLADRKALEMERRAHAENVAAAITAMSAVSESVEANTREVATLSKTMAAEHSSAETFRQAWFTVMGQRRPPPRPVKIEPIR